MSQSASFSLSKNFSTRIAVAVLVAMGLAVIIVVVSAQGQGGGTVSGRLGGDFPAFYGAAQIVTEGQVDNLYDVQTQGEAQADLWGEETPGVLYFAYPPHIAAVYSWFAFLSYPAAYALHTLCMFGFLLLAMRLAKPLLPGLAKGWLIALAAVVSFYPLFRSVTAGQNTSLTLLLLVIFWRLLTSKHDFWAGIILAVMLFKPQYALPLIGLSLLSKHWKVGVGAAIGAAGLWSWAALWLHPNWFADWWDQATAFSQKDAVVNAKNSVSGPGFFEAVADGRFVWFGWVISAVVIASVSWIWARRTDLPLSARMAVAAPSLLLLSPHSMFYDSGLIAISLGVLVVRGPLQRVRAAAVVWGFGFSHIIASFLGWNPLFFVVFAVWLWSIWMLVWANPQSDGKNRQTLAELEQAQGSLSIIVPVYNESDRIAGTLRSMATYLESSVWDAEIIVVDDGSTDNTIEVVAAHAHLFTDVKLLRVRSNSGKGYAVRAGMLSASGDMRLFMDADNATELAQLDCVLQQVQRVKPDADIAVGSIASGATQVLAAQPGLRQILGRCGNFAAQALIIPGLRDTQRGFKLFTAEAAEAAFRHSESDRWVFDMEILARARRSGFRLVEVPVAWQHIPGGSIRSASYFSSLLELFRIALRLVAERIGVRDKQTVEIKEVLQPIPSFRSPLEYQNWFADNDMPAKDERKKAIQN